MSVAGIFSGIYGATFQVSPILLTNGLASNIIGGIAGAIGATSSLTSILKSIGIPLSALTELGALNMINGVPQQSFANYRPLPGSTILKYQIAEYPFYNQQIAANASIQQPNNISLLMYCPANKNTNVTVKLAIMSAVKATIEAHVQSGGTFTVLTPSQIYTDCLLTGITDVSTEATNQAQWAYQWDFTQPLLTFPSGAGSFSNSLNSFFGGGTL